MSKIYAAQPRFLTFPEAGIVERSLMARLHLLEQEGGGESPEATHTHQILRDLVYFTDADTLDDLQVYLQAQGWIDDGLWADGAYKTFLAPERRGRKNRTASRSRISVALPAKMDFDHAEETVRRAMFFLAFLEDPKTVSAYNILQQMRITVAGMNCSS